MKLKKVVWGLMGITAVLCLTLVLRALPGQTPRMFLPIVQRSEIDGDAILFAVIGDFGIAGEKEAAVAALVKSWQPEFIITTGDNNYPSGSASTIDVNIGQYYSEYIYPYTGVYTATETVNRFFPSLGNHDWDSDDAQAYLDYFPIDSSVANSGSSQNERYYDFVQGPVHFFVVDSDIREPDGIRFDSKQGEWLQTQLAASQTPWQIVYLHHPPYSSGWHGSSHLLRWPFAEWGADAVLAGHEHSYERVLQDGIPYFINGSGGQSLRMFLVPVSGSQVRYKDDNGAMWVQATETAVTFQFFSIANGGELIDSYEITR